jgi:hypothetical protein
MYRYLTSHIGRLGAILVLGIAAVELLIMISPFAGLFFTSLRYESLLGVWVTMLFLYAGLARFEELRMTARFGDTYLQYKASKGAFLPGSPVHRLFEGTFGKLRPRFLGWVVAYVVCLALAFSAGFGLRAMTRASSALVFKPDHHMVAISVWPKPDGWINEAVDTALQNKQVSDRINAARRGSPVVATILPPLYAMRGMYYRRGLATDLTMQSFSFRRLRGIFLRHLLPVKDYFWETFMGVDPEDYRPVKIVFSRAEKPYKTTLPLAESLDAGIRTTPLVVISFLPSTKKVFGVIIPLPQNTWGPQVVMPFL